ncbi:MATE family efflux transporter [Sediminispirochaeta bajacaliforniensis]|uniref:MATE family efflux transporter n=1 Tax=Sediminispirochaeta bajacaliforniensis TaxID=148 RepID=UPI00037DCBB3|nr:MATE family efflux transporter [Sediminispirochaeta bajacaliforniensis]
MHVTDQLFGDRSFRKELLRIAVPVALQNLLISSLSVVDTLMLGQLGEVEIAAVGLANQLFFLSLLFFFGVSSGASVFIAQFWGKKDIPSIHRTVGFAFSFAGSAAILFSLLSLTIPDQILRIFTTDEAVVTVGIEYLRVVGISYLFVAASVLASVSLRSIEEAVTPLRATTASIIANIILNYLFIFGKFGFPQMGVAGAALATTISRGLELIILYHAIFVKKNILAAPVRVFFDFNRSFVRRFLKTATPVILNEMAWATGMVVYKIVFARMGTGVIAAMNIVDTASNLLFIIFMGTSNACAVMIGKRVGMGKREEAFTAGKHFIAIGFFFGAVVGLGALLLARFIPGLFNVSDQVKLMTAQVLRLFPIIFPLKALNIHTVIGIFRAGGDTAFSFFVDLSGVWLVGVPLAFLGAFVWELPIHLLFLLLGMEEVCKTIMGLLRFRSRLWIRDITEGEVSA